MARSQTFLLVLVLALGGLAASLAVWPAAPSRAAPRTALPRPLSLAPAPRPVVRRVPTSAPAALVATVRQGADVLLRARPGGPVVGRLGARTEFGSAQRLAVVRARGRRWLAVISPALPNGRIAWIDAAAVSVSRTRIELEVDLSQRELRVRRGSRLLRRIPVGIGRPGSPTPVGRFSITDKLPGARYSPVYGCCILALSGHQTHLPAGWQGGDRLAIHGGSRGAVSAGCLHADEHDLRVLMRLVPLGAQVTIHP